MADQPNTNFVALLGTTLGVKKASLIEWGKWLQWTGYSPTIFYDCALPQDNVKCHQQYPPTIKTHELHDEIAKDHPWVWDGPEGDVIVKRADGTRLYAFHDLSFADWVDPTHYITGQEQREHFKSLGFEDKHLPMGLVLGDDGKKLKSREGTAMPINDALGLAAERLEDTPEPGKLAWNVLVWNILSAKRENDLKFQVENWTNPSLPGMYVSYTYSRVHAALSRSMTTCCKGKLFAFNRDDELVEQEFMDVDLRLLGVAEQYHWHRQQSIERFDPCLLAAYSMTLATVLSGAYQKEQIKGGRPAFVAAIGHALYRLHACMEDLGLFPLETV
jgi:arginyl-tRNA synthetase